MLVASQHDALRRGVQLILQQDGFRVVAGCGDAAESIAAAHRLRPELCLLDIDLSGGGVRAATEIYRALPGIRIVLLTTTFRASDLFAALRAGAVGYLPKSIAPDRLVTTLRRVLEGEAALPRTLVGRLVEAFRDQQIQEDADGAAADLSGLGLTAREQDVLRLLSLGYSTFEIAKRLEIQQVTARSHLASTLQKLQVPDRDAAVELVLRRRAARPATEFQRRSAADRDAAADMSSGVPPARVSSG